MALTYINIYLMLFHISKQQLLSLRLFHYSLKFQDVREKIENSRQEAHFFSYLVLKK